MKKVLVIGNSDSVFNKTLGHKVEDYNFVIRINRFQIKGAEAFVGKRITHWVIFPCPVLLKHLENNLYNGHIPIDPMKVKIWWRHEQQKFVSQKKKMILKRLKTPDYNISKVPLELKLELKDLLGLKPDDGMGPSTGLTAIAMAMKRWRGPIDVMGFGLGNEFKKDYYCQWERLKDEYRCHDMLAERRLLTQWEKDEKIRRIDN